MSRDLAAIFHEDGDDKRSPNVEYPPSLYRCIPCRAIRTYGNGKPEYHRQVFIWCFGTCKRNAPHVFTEVM